METGTAVLLFVVLGALGFLVYVLAVCIVSVISPGHTVRRLRGLVQAEQYRRALRARESSGPTRAIRLHYKSVAAYRLAEYAEARRLAEAAIADAHATPEIRLASRQLCFLVGLARDDVSGARLHLDVDPAEPALHASRIKLAIELGEHDLAERLLAEAAGTPEAEARRRRDLAQLRLRQCRYAEAAHELALALESCVKVADLAEAATLEVVIKALWAHVELWSGNPQRGRLLMEQALATSRSAELTVPSLPTSAAIVLAATGDAASARVQLNLAQEPTRSLGLPLWFWAHAEVARAEGDAEAALAAYTRAIAAADSIGMTPTGEQVRRRLDELAPTR